MIFPKVSLGEWVERYRLRSRIYTCPGCGRKFETTIPVVIKDGVGLSSPVHECGAGCVGVVLVPRTPEEISLFRDAFA